MKKVPLIQVPKKDMDDDQKMMNSSSGRHWVAYFMLIMIISFIIFAISYHSLRQSKNLFPKLNELIYKEVQNAKNIEKNSKMIEQSTEKVIKNSFDLVDITKRQEQIEIERKEDSNRVEAINKLIEQKDIQDKNQNLNMNKVTLLNEKSIAKITQLSNELGSYAESHNNDKKKINDQIKELNSNVQKIITNQENILKSLESSKNNIRILDENLRLLSTKIPKKALAQKK